MSQEGVSAKTDIMDTDPISYLWTHPHDKNLSQRNRENYALLLSTYRRTDFVSFTGAGVSTPLGIFDWNRLMRELHEIAQSHGFDQSMPDKAEYPEFAENIYRFLEEKNQQSNYYELLKKTMTPHINSTSLTLVYLALSMDMHLTTNFDRSIEHAYNFVKFFARFFFAEANYELPSLNYLRALDVSSARPSLFYLHGCVVENTYILRKSDYDLFYPSVSGSTTNCVKELEDCLTHFYKRNTIVFIGFSFQDPYVKKFFLNLAKVIENEQKMTGKFYYSQGGQEIKTKEIKHFILMEGNNLLSKELNKEIFAEYEEYKLYPIIYQTGEHVFLELLFKKFIEKDRGT